MTIRGIRRPEVARPRNATSSSHSQHKKNGDSKQQITTRRENFRKRSSAFQKSTIDFFTGCLLVCSLLFTARTVLIATSNTMPTNFDSSFRHDGPWFATNTTYSKQQQSYTDTNINEWWLPRRNTVQYPNLSHPHMGARHFNGSLGMVVNPSVQRLVRSNWNLNQTFNNITCPAKSYGMEGPGGNQVLQKVRNGLIKARTALISSSPGEASPKILCMVFTIYTTKDQHSNLKAIAETWAKECDGFIAASNMTQHEFGAIDFPHQGPEDYGNMWQKIRSMWTYAYDYYLQDYDAFYIGGDDTFLIVDHLRFFLQSQHVKDLENGQLDRISQYYKSDAARTASLRPRPLIFGMPWHHKNFPMISGGGGYVLNRAALELWGTQGADTFRVDFVDSREDIFVTDFFREQGVQISDTQDDKGGWRFGRGSAQIHSEFDGRTSGKRSPMHPAHQEMFGFQNSLGIDTSSEHQISFHLKEDKARLAAAGYQVSDLILRYHAILNSLCSEAETQTSNGSALDQIWLGHSLDMEATPKMESQHPWLTVVMTYCKGPFDWLPPFLGEHKISSFTIVSKCGANPEIPKLQQVDVEVRNVPNIGGCDHTMAQWMGEVLNMKENEQFGDNDLVLFLKDNLYIHQPGQRKRTLAEMVSIASSPRGFGCFLEPADGKSILHETKVLGHFSLPAYRGNRNGFKSPKYSKFQDWQLDMNITLPSPLVHICYGGTYVVKKSHIAKLPRSLYKSIEESLSRSDKIEEAHFAERSWAGLLSKPLEQKEVEIVYQSEFDVLPPGQSYTGTLMRKNVPAF